MKNCLADVRCGKSREKWTHIPDAQHYIQLRSSTPEFHRATVTVANFLRHRINTVFTLAHCLSISLHLWISSPDIHMTTDTYSCQHSKALHQCSILPSVGSNYITSTVNFLTWVSWDHSYSSHHSKAMHQSLAIVTIYKYIKLYIIYILLCDDLRWHCPSSHTRIVC